MRGSGVAEPSSSSWQWQRGYVNGRIQRREYVHTWAANSPKNSLTITFPSETRRKHLPSEVGFSKSEEYYTETSLQSLTPDAKGKERYHTTGPICQGEIKLIYGFLNLQRHTPRVGYDRRKRSEQRCQWHTWTGCLCGSPNRLFHIDTLCFVRDARYRGSFNSTSMVQGHLSMLS